MRLVPSQQPLIPACYWRYGIVLNLGSWHGIRLCRFVSALHDLTGQHDLPHPIEFIYSDSYQK